MTQEEKHLSPRFPKILARLMASNQHLKAFSVAALCMSAMTVAALLVSLTRPPLVLTLNSHGQRVDRTEVAPAIDQVREAARAYLDLRYRWEPSNVKAHLASAQAFVRPASLKEYQIAATNLVRFSTEKQVSQRIYPESLSVDLTKGEIAIAGDRITVVQGLRAAGALNLVLKFEGGPRNEANPWGFYIAQEKEVQ